MINMGYLDSVDSEFTEDMESVLDSYSQKVSRFAGSFRTL
jgi:hypothetical protein